MVNQARKAFVRPLLYLCGSVLAAACTTKTSNDERTYLELAQGLMSDGNFPQCVSTADSVLQANPKSGSAMNIKGLCLMGIGRHAEAEVLLKQACEIQPTPECYNQLAAVYLKLKNSAKSEEMGLKALSYPSYSSTENAWANIALARLQRKDLGGAQKAAESALATNRSNCSLRFLVVRVLQRRGLPEPALRNAQEGVTLCPMADEAHFWLAYSYYKIGRRRDAATTYRFIVNQFKRGSLVEQSKVNLDLLENQIPIPEPTL